MRACRTGHAAHRARYFTAIHRHYVTVSAALLVHHTRRVPCGAPARPFARPHPHLLESLVWFPGAVVRAKLGFARRSCCWGLPYRPPRLFVAWTRACWAWSQAHDYHRAQTPRSRPPAPRTPYCWLPAGQHSRVNCDPTAFQPSRDPSICWQLEWHRQQY